jgi:hypothetical protein
MKLTSALERAFDAAHCALLSCVPGELAYMDGDLDRYILWRHPVS